LDSRASQFDALFFEGSGPGAFRAEHNAERLFRAIAGTGHQTLSPFAKRADASLRPNIGNVCGFSDTREPPGPRLEHIFSASAHVLRGGEGTR
jgi:hypothetical protein